MLGDSVWKRRLKEIVDAIPSTNTIEAHLLPFDEKGAHLLPYDEKMEQAIAHWLLPDFLDVFALDYIVKDKEKLVATIDREGNVLLSGIAHFRHLSLLNALGTRVYYSKEKKCFILGTLRSPRMIRAIFAELREIYPNVYLAVKKLEDWPVREKIECPITHLGEFSLEEKHREIIKSILESFTYGFKSYLLAYDEDRHANPPFFNDYELVALAVSKILDKPAVVLAKEYDLDFWRTKAEKAGVKISFLVQENFSSDVDLSGKVLIIDRAQYLGNFRMERTRKTFPLIEKAERVIAIAKATPFWYGIERFSRIMRSLGMLYQLSDFRGKFGECKERGWRSLYGGAMSFALDNLYPVWWEKVDYYGR